MKTVLVIDDESEFVSLVEKRLGRFYQVLKAFDGEQGLMIALDKKPDLILCDILMPKKDGHQLVRELRFHAETKDIPVLLLSAVGDTSSLLRASEMGVADYLIKPIQFEQLPELVEHYLRTGRMPF